jgi:hypothetical protein
MTTVEILGWEDGIARAPTAAERKKYLGMLKEEIRTRGLEGVDEGMVDIVIRSYS